MTLFEQEVDDVEVEVERGWQRNVLQRGSVGSWLAHLQRLVSLVGNDDRDRLVAIHHRDAMSLANGPQMLTQPGLELGDSDGVHGHRMVNR